MFGFGPFAGFLTLSLSTIGFLSKLLADDIEEIDPGQVEAIRATGASRVQEVVFGVVPQVMPLWMSYALYRFESNVRAATVLGVIGAGGIGQALFEAIRGFYYPQASAMLIIMLVTVSLLDLLSQQVRKLFL
jgi:phosphonate transport system permease protein